MEQATEESLSFLDECTVVCLGYISAKGNVDVDANTSIDDESYRSLCFVVEQELQEFSKKGDLGNIMANASFLAKQYHENEESLRKTKNLLKRFDSSLDEETFSSCLSEIITLPVQSWNSVASVLQFLYKACAYLGNDKMGSVIDVGVRYMRRTMMDFVNKEGGWSSLIRKKDAGDDISSSIVVVSSEGMSQSEMRADMQRADIGDSSPNEGGEAASLISNEAAEREAALKSPVHPPVPISPLNTPPYSFPSSVTTDDERDSLATPPELVERPQMTESYMQAMGEDGAHRMSDGNGFEFINSENGGSEKADSQKLDDIQAFDPPTQQDNIPSVSTPLTEEPTQSARAKDEDSIFGRYLPHISLGVAVAAAAAGLIVLKKNM